MAVPFTIQGVFEGYVENMPRLAHEYLDYLTAAQATGSEHPRLAHLHRCRISKLEVRKCKHSPEHEFVLAFVDYAGTPEQRAVFRVERSVHPDTVKHSSGVIGSARSAGSSSPNPTAIAIQANDYVGRYHSLDAALGTDKDARLCYTLSFEDDNRPSIIDLASAAAALNEIAPDYDIFKYMCYWYAHHMCVLLAHGRNPSCSVPAKRKARAGYFRGFPLLANGVLQPETARAAEEDEAPRKPAPPCWNDFLHAAKKRKDLFNVDAEAAPKAGDPATEVAFIASTNAEYVECYSRIVGEAQRKIEEMDRAREPFEVRLQRERRRVAALQASSEAKDREIQDLLERVASLEGQMGA